MALAQGAWHGDGDQSRRVPEPQGEFGLIYGLGSRQGEVQMGFNQGGVVVSFVLEEDHPVCGMENKRGVSGRRGCWDLRAAAVPHICTRTSGEKSRLDRGGPGRAGVEAGGDLIPASPSLASCLKACGFAESRLPSHQEKPPLVRILGHGTLY